MKNIIISALLIGFTILTYAQNSNTVKSNAPGDEGKRTFSEITVGMAVPSGDYASSDTPLEKSGFAVNSGFLFVNYGIIYNNYFGFEIAFSMGINPLNKKIDDKLNQADYSYNTYYDYGKWMNMNIMLGPHLSIPIQNFSLDLRLLGGYMYLRRPFIKQIFDKGAWVVEEKAGYGYAFVWQFGAGMRYSVSKNFDIKFSLDYFKAKPEIKYQKVIFQNAVIIEEDATYYGILTGLDNKKYTQSISSYNFGVGIVFYPK